MLRGGAAKCAAVSADLTADGLTADAGLAAIIYRWPTLPAEAKAAIAAIIRNPTELPA
jgi:hypothetical protein